MDEIHYSDTLGEEISSNIRKDFRVFSNTPTSINEIPDVYTVCHNHAQCIAQVKFQPTQMDAPIIGIPEEAMLLMLIHRMKNRIAQCPGVDGPMATAIIHLEEALHKLNK